MHRSPIRGARFALRRLRPVAVALVLLLVPAAALAQANGRLQIHHMKVGQGDGILLISPNGQTALFDDGVYTNCTYIKSYIQGLGISVVDYHFASHYHADHIGCIDDLAAIGITIGDTGYDRGYSYSSATYTSYVNTLGAKRQTIAKGQTITLDAGAPNPVTITCVDLNGAGVYSPSGSDENAKSVVLKVSHGAFDEVLGGDLTGDGSTDVETTVGPQVGDVEVYKVHHHGSRYSTNDNWLAAITPEVAIIQVGDGNTYGHPTAEALARLHARGVYTYWNEIGSGVSPDPQWDTVADETILVEADPGETQGYTVSGPGFSDTYPNGGGGPPPVQTETVVASSVTTLVGSVTSGSVASLAADDASRMTVTAAKSGKWRTDWYGSVFVNHPPTSLTITYDGNYSVSRTQTIYLWNWSSGSWTQVDQASIGTSDVTRTYTTASPTAFVSGANEVRVRVLGNNRNSTYSCRADYLAVTYDYLEGTLRAPIAERAIAHADRGHPAVTEPDPEHILPLSSLTRVASAPEARGIVLDWATDANAHLDGFNVYREDEAGKRVFVGGEAVVGNDGREVTFRFVDTAPAGPGVYWLGARACAGPEGMIGPIRVTAAAAPVALDFAVAGNPVRGSARFELGVPHAADVTLEIFDVTGRRVAAPFSGAVPAGRASLEWNLTGDSGVKVLPGVYFARLEGLARTMFTRVTVLED